MTRIYDAKPYIAFKLAAPLKQIDDVWVFDINIPEDTFGPLWDKCGEAYDECLVTVGMDNTVQVRQDVSVRYFVPKLVHMATYSPSHVVFQRSTCKKNIMLSQAEFMDEYVARTKKMKSVFFEKQLRKNRDVVNVMYINSDTNILSFDTVLCHDGNIEPWPSNLRSISTSSNS